jgi:diacylglycerol kinase
LTHINNKPFSFSARLKSVGYAFQGIVVFFKTQHNALIQVVAAIVVIILGFVLKVNTTEWCLLIFTIGLVFITEMLNTAIEFLTDLASPEIHPLAKKVKDVAAGAVLIAAIAAAVIGGIILLPKIVVLLSC